MMTIKMKLGSKAAIFCWCTRKLDPISQGDKDSCSFGNKAPLLTEGNVSLLSEEQCLATSCYESPKPKVSDQKPQIGVHKL